MPAPVSMGPSSPERIEAPVTLKAYLMCAFAAFAGILYGYDSGYINSVLTMNEFLRQFGQEAADGTYFYSASRESLTVSILSAGTFFGSLSAGTLADIIGRRTTIIGGCGVFMVGVILQMAAAAFPLLVVGRFIAGVGMGFVSAVNILYMSEVAPRKVRGAIVSCYQFAITIGLLLAAAIGYGTKNIGNSGAYRIPIGLQFFWSATLALGLFMLPESPRYFVKKQRLDKAQEALARVRGQPVDSEFVQEELAEIQANYEYEMQVGEVSWIGCFKGGLGNRNSNIRKVFIGVLLQMFQQWTGVNFIFYYSTSFFESIGIKNSFLISMITDIVNVFSTPVSFYTIERFGRRPLLIYGAAAMTVCQFIVAITGVCTTSSAANNVLIAFVCIYIFCFASTWGPTAWVTIGEIYPLPIRSKGVAMGTASNWFWNCIIAVITPYLVDKDEANLSFKVFFLWGSLCATCGVWAYFFVPETKGLSLEQVDKMMEECTARKSAGWVPHDTFVHEMDLKSGKDMEQSEFQEVVGKQDV